MTIENDPDSAPRCVVRPQVLAVSLATLLVGCMAVLWVLRATSPTLRSPVPPRKAPAEKISEPPADAKPAPTLAQKRIRVDVRMESAPSAAAVAAVEKGKLIVTTRVAVATPVETFLTALMGRGGIVVVEDSAGRYWLREAAGKFSPLQGSLVRLEDYSLDRPRLLASEHLTDLVTGAQFEPRRGFLVMPRGFEADLLGRVEREVATPLERVVSATVTASVSTAGYLNFSVDEIELVEGRRLFPQSVVRGL